MAFVPAAFSFSCSSYTSSQLLFHPKISKLTFSSTTISPSLISIPDLQRQRKPHFSSLCITASKFSSSAVPAPNNKKSTKTTTQNPEVEEWLPLRVSQISLDGKKFDPIYHNRLVNMLVNRVMKKGKKSLAYQIIYRAMKRIQQKTKANPLFLLRQAIVAVTPDVVVKARRVGGSTHQVPIEIGSTQGRALAIRWLLGASRKRHGRSMVFKLSSELMEAAKGSGDAIRKKEEAYKRAEDNRAFAHFR